MLDLSPIPILLARTRSELSASFDFRKPIRLSRAPGSLDVMGGIAQYSGSLVCTSTIDRAAGVVLQERDDRELQVFSFNLFDEHLPFTFRMPLDALKKVDADALCRGFAEPGRRWAADVVGCLYVLHERKLLDLGDPRIRGLNLAVLSTVPSNVNLASSAAIQMATMMNVLDHFQIRDFVDPLSVAEICREVQNRIAGASGNPIERIGCCLGQPDTLLRIVCQPHELQPALILPADIRIIGINSNVKTSPARDRYDRTRTAAFMGHAIILSWMRRLGEAAGRELVSDPMNGYLANLDPDDYKQHFRPHLPETIRGGEFIATYGSVIDCIGKVEPKNGYRVLQATDHHVLEARRVRRFVEFLEQASTLPAGSRRRKGALDKAGHLMYASHVSYANDALLGSPECDLLVKLVREREHEGFYGARITGVGCGGTVAVLCDQTDRADAAISQVQAEYEKQTSRRSEALVLSTAGAWNAGTVRVNV